MTEIQQGLIAVGVFVAAGCKPCTAYHVKAARAAGAGDEEIRRAICHALNVRRNATEIMARLADKLLGNGLNLDVTLPPEKSLIGELVSAGAALAVNCGSNLEAHLLAAQELGAGDHHLQTTLTIARAVKNMAGKKVEEVAKKIAPTDECYLVDSSCQTDGDRPAQSASTCSCAEADRTAARR